LSTVGGAAFKTLDPTTQRNSTPQQKPGFKAGNDEFVAAWNKPDGPDLSSMSKETPQDDPRQQTDWNNTKQTDEPWKGATEKDQLDPNRPKPDLEKWHDTNTH
jgi:hypothetical protein